MSSLLFTSLLPPSFFLLGLLNNSSYVIMLAGAKEISEGGVALVFICNVLPSFMCKLTGPIWFHKVKYELRMKACMILMSSSFIIVAFSSDYRGKLLGVAAASLQSGLGEASILALASRYVGTRECLTAWSSGTGAAGGEKEYGCSIRVKSINVCWLTLSRCSFRIRIRLGV
jgi:battenin